MKLRYFNYLFNQDGKNIAPSLLNLFNEYTSKSNKGPIKAIEIAEQPYYLISSEEADGLFYLVSINSNSSQRYINKKSFNVCELHERLEEDELLGSLTYIYIDKSSPCVSILSTLGSPRYGCLETFVNCMMESLDNAEGLENFQLVEMCEIVNKTKLRNLEMVVDAGFTLHKDSSKFDTMCNAFNLDSNSAKEVGSFRVIIEREPKTTLKGCLKNLLDNNDITELTARGKDDLLKGALTELALDASKSLSENINRRVNMTLDQQIATKFEENKNVARLTKSFIKLHDVELVK